jgi:uncharacterized membrane protein YkoI
MKKKHILVLSALATGMLAFGLTVAPGVANADDDDTLKRTDLPAPVRTTVQREVKQGTITDIEKDQENGNVVYEVEFTDGGKNWEIDVAPDGKLLQRHVD